MKSKWILTAIVNGASFLFFLMMTLLSSRISGSLSDQQAAEKWAGRESPSYAQVSAYTAETSAIGIDDVFMTRVNVDKKLLENSLTAERESSRLWTDAFSSAQRTITVFAESRSAEANMIVTGGDFFLFHTLDMLYGSCYYDDDFTHDRVVIDEVLAWQLYGSSDIEGMPVIINEKYFFVAGVFRQSDNSELKKVYGEKPRIFMSYRGYELMTGEEARFICYEACLPNPVTGMGAQIVTEALSLDENFSRKVENSARYGLKNRFSIIADFGTRSVVDSTVYYPYWENAARISEDKSALLLVMQLIGLAIPTCTVVYLFVRLIRNRKKLLNKALNALKRILDNIRKRKEEKAFGKESSAKVSANG